MCASAAQSKSPNVAPQSPQPIQDTTTGQPKTAILMLNMGGPECSLDVEEYLRRIMTDREMIQLPMQSQLGPWIAKRRAPEVTKKYDEIGGGSPILKWTNIQGNLLCKKLDAISPQSAPHKHYVGFRYADPLTEDTLGIIEKDKPEHVVLFSQYPQYCCATSGSSFNSIYTYFRSRAMPPRMKWSVIDRWGWHPLLAETFADRIQNELNEFDKSIRDDVVILFSAHSIPLKVKSRIIFYK